MNEIDNFILVVSGPIRKFTRQLCDCADSDCIDYSEFVGNSTVQTTYNVCSVCHKPYNIDYDTSNISLIKNIGDSDAEEKGKEKTNS